MDGVLLIDKSAGRTSNNLVEAVKRVAGERRIGHTGTLDPLATGLLVLALGPATRAVPFLEGFAKRYLVAVRLGVTTDSDDADGRVVSEHPVPKLCDEQVRLHVAPFLGEFDQRPPRVSAVRVDGERAYVRARRGEAVDPPARRVRIDAIDVIEVDAPLVRLDVRCGSGTYMRSLARDLGASLGCGGIVHDLRRTEIGPFRVDDALKDVELSPDLVRARLRSVDDALSFLPAVTLDVDALRRFTDGRTVPVDAPAGRLRVHGPAGLAGVGERTGEGLRPLRVFTR